jgi:uncharacterized membrane protein YbhN (UPF0104 family)
VVAPKAILNRRLFWSLAYGTIFGGIIFYFIAAWAGVENIWYQIADINAGYLSIYLGLTIGTYLLRAWRFQLLIGGNGIISKLYGVVSIHNLMVNLLPFSGGELSYPLLLKHYGLSSRFFDGIPSIVFARFQDLLLSGFFFGAAVVWVGRLSGIFVETLVNFILLSALVIVVGCLIYRLSARKTGLIAKVGFLSEVISSVKKFDLSVWLGSFVIALTARVISIIATFYLIQAVGLSLSFATVFLICSAYVFLPLLPINTVAGLGITEAFLLAFFVGSGVDERTAAVASVHVHLLQLIIAASLGLFGALQLEWLSRQRSSFLRDKDTEALC